MESLTKLKPDFYREIINEAAGLKGYVVIDRQVNGAATGGIRMAPNVTLDEIANLAHEMTLKYAIFRIKKDGAKAGIVAPDPEVGQQKEMLCKVFGGEIRDLIREEKYFPGQDLGIDSSDLVEIFSGAGIERVKCGSGIDSGYFTALTVYLTLQEIFNASKNNIEETSFIVEGFGKVGAQLSKLITVAGAKIYGISTAYGAVFDPEGLDMFKVNELKIKHGDRFVHYYGKDKEIQKEKLIFKQADVFIPGARPDSINVHNVDQLKFKIIVPIANIAATEEVEHMLFEKGVVFVPGFVSNAGGILGYYFEEQGFDSEMVKNIILKGFPKSIKRLITEAQAGGTSISKVARDHALKNIKLMEEEHRLPVIKKMSITRILWILFKSLIKMRASAVLRPIAVNYIENKHFN